MKHADILIVDDEIKFADMLAKRIELRGCSSAVCYDGRSALEWVKSHARGIALILLDLRLPDLYGTEVLIGIKEINPAIPVIILTGHGTEKDRQECERLGAYRFIHKPPKIDELMSIFEHIREKSEC
jgi:DNA-binding NtrC family response regulator